jgi:general bacterial porin, GBP family
MEALVSHLNNLEIHMKKSLLALAVLGAFAGAASAQSSVTLYGRVDAGVQRNEAGINVGTATSPIFRQESATSLDGGYANGNRWGLRGSESLGGDLSAVFTLESGFNIDTGGSAQGSAAVSNRLFGRQATLGLSSRSLGTLVAGRAGTFSSGTGSLDFVSRFDPYETGWGINGIGSTFLSAGALRSDNVVAYVSPTWSGLRLGASYAFNLDGAESVASSNNTKVTTLAGSFDMGAFAVAVTYDIVDHAQTTVRTVGTLNTPVDDQKHLQIVGSYDFKVAKLFAGYAMQESITAVVSSAIPIPAFARGLTDIDSWYVAASVPLGAFKIYGSYQSAMADSVTVTGTGGGTFEPDYDVWSLGLQYDFSRRTKAYLGYGSRSASGTLNSNQFDRTQLAVGIGHAF